MKREEHVLNETFSYRYPGKDAYHAILIQHGIASVPSRATRVGPTVSLIRSSAANL
jgi:hypothetical protein